MLETVRATKTAIDARAFASEIRYELACGANIRWADVRVSVREPNASSPHTEITFHYNGRSTTLQEQLNAVQALRDRGDYAPYLETIVRDLASILQL